MAPRAGPARLGLTVPSPHMLAGAAHAQYPVSQPRHSRQADRALFEHHPRQGVGGLVHRRPGRDGQKRQDARRFEGQCAQVFANIGAALASQGAGFPNIVEFTSYLVHSQDIGKFVEYRAREYPRLFPDGSYPTNTLLIVDRLVREEFLIEVSAVAAL
jgi:enamine deaminase RidA (YjgF/YER057c/UK114 family)